MGKRPTLKIHLAKAGFSIAVITFYLGITQLFPDLWPCQGVVGFSISEVYLLSKHYLKSKMLSTSASILQDCLGFQNQAYERNPKKVFPEKSGRCTLG